MRDITVRMQVSGTPVDHLYVSSPADWWASVWAYIAPSLPPAWVWWIVLAILGVFAGWKAGRALIRAAGRTWAAASARPVEDVLTVVAASIATAVSAQGMWRFSGDVLGLTGPLRLLLFAFIEVAIITSAVRARRNMRENYSAGIDGVAVWALTCLTALLSSMDAHSVPEAVFRLAAPLVAAWLWERGMKLERLRLTGLRAVHWRITPERIFVWLGLAEATDRTAGEVDAQRRTNQVAAAALRVDDLRAANASERRQRRALTAFRRSIAQAVEHAGLATDEGQQEAVLAKLDTLRSTDALVNRRRIARWADPFTASQRADALSTIEDATRFDTAEATQRALDKAALTLMALTESVTSDVTSSRVNDGLNIEVNGHAIPPPRSATKLTSAVTPELTVERVNGGLNFDVNDASVYDLERMLFADPYVTPELSGQLTAAGLNADVNDDLEDGTKTQVMEDFWRSEAAVDRYPTVKELADYAAVHPSHASRKRKEWVAELPWRQRRKADPRRDRSPS